MVVLEWSIDCNSTYSKKLVSLQYFILNLTLVHILLNALELLHVRAVLGSVLCGVDMRWEKGSYLEFMGFQE